MTALWRILSSSPHRALFLAGALESILAMFWWLLVLETRGQGGLAVAQIPESAAHAWLMLYGLFPFFIFGFLFTALPNWVNGPPIPRKAYLGSAVLLSLGAGLFYPGIYWLPLAGVALALHSVGWAVGLLALLGNLRSARPDPHLRQAWLTWFALLAGLLGTLTFAAARLLDSDALLRTASSIAVWGFLTPLFLAVCHRMIPFFTSRIVPNYVVVRPYAPLWVMLGACLAHAALEILQLDRWTWLVDLPLAGIALWFINRWGIARSLSERLLGMLHIGLVWGAFAFLLYGLDSLLAWLGSDLSFGLAPLHALGIGFFASLLLAMASRVSLGHSGRPLKADRLTWGLFWLLQLTALVRMAPDLLPGLVAYRAISLAAGLWLIGFGIWAWRYAPFYWRPRVDGKPG